MSVAKYIPVKGNSSQVIDVDTDSLQKVIQNCNGIKCSKHASSFSAESFATTYISSLFASIEANISGAIALSRAVATLKNRIENIKNP